MLRCWGAGGGAKVPHTEDSEDPEALLGVRHRKKAGRTEHQTVRVTRKPHLPLLGCSVELGRPLGPGGRGHHRQPWTLDGA